MNTQSYPNDREAEPKQWQLRLYVAGQTPKSLLAFANLKRLYLSCGEGFIDVINQLSADTYQLRERIPTRTGARTAFFSKDLNEFYLAVPQRGNQMAELRVFQAQP